jgi:hypothetical protein
MKHCIKIILFVFTNIAYIISCGLTTSKTIENENEPCNSLKNTTHKIYFLKDTTSSDFQKLLNFIESKGEFSRYDRKHKIDSSINNHILLKKLLCEEMYFDSPIEEWILEGIYSTRYLMTSRKPVKGQPNFYPKFSITQYNFKTEKEKEKALDKIKEIGLGDPLKKWNSYYILSNRTRIIALQSFVPMVTETKRKYGKLIEIEWIPQNSY